MQRERIADDIYVFVSDLYAQATATLIQTDEGAVLFDTLLYTEETLAIRRFVETRLHSQVRCVINSHYHADHTTGTYLFEGAQVVSNARCRDLLDRRGRASLERSQVSTPALRDAAIILPTIAFEGQRYSLHFGNKTFDMWMTPGHSPDSMVCLVREDRVLLAADTVMPIPYFVDGSLDQFLVSLRGLREGSYEHIIQGHGEIVLRGEIDAKIESDILYLTTLDSLVNEALSSASPEQMLTAVTIERCGKRRVELGGLADQLHQRNILMLIRQHAARQLREQTHE